MGTDSASHVVAMYDAFARGDVAAVLGGMADDIEWVEAEGMPYGGAIRGPAAVAEGVFARVMADIPDFSVTPEEFIASGDTVAVIARYRGTGAVNGNVLDLPVVHVWDVHDGKVTRFRQFTDASRFREVVPATAGAASAS
jgi:ketosteroid isomerase-like protein